MKFADLGLSDELLRAIDDAGYSEATPIQAGAIPSVLMMRDMIGIAQTGTGKTASFVLPMIDILAHGRARALMPRSLILEPTRELAAQVAENFEKYGKHHKLSMALLIGGVQMGDQVKALEKGVDVLIATPGRLMDLFERGKILLTGCNLLVIDEADRMLDMGFIPDIENICTKLPANRQTLLFSATMPPPIKKLADKFLSNPKTIEVARPASRNENIEQFIVKTSERGKRDMLRSLIEAEDIHTAIIFCNRKTTVRELAKSLQRYRYKAGEIHGDMDQSSRIAELDRFKNGTINILVASDVAARGLDVKGVSHVFNFDAPWHPDDYVHRIGRTGRAGAKGRAFTLVTPSDDEAIDNIQKLTGYKIPVHAADESGAESAGNEQSDDTDESRRGRSVRGGRGKSAAKPEKTEARPAAKAEPRSAAKAEPRSAAKAETKPAKPPRGDRKPAPSARRDDQDGPDDGWNGPMPDFLSVGFGS
ncbi:DEAD/DEAH box helicase [Sphingopyxis sp. JAI128]|uniref:DEAD/DEAH box helicase n=1 Tax=Sphingopyxis sp. JAI128 TaxID=2723066 RepID=UPI00161789BA|nr:DEAD/DEAH box helicase [Sphingopyxis sp. JAI128]MBB6424456.1 superfamily II DNA/RNA helicase [Sphingopyxis sp. JAI128]